MVRLFFAIVGIVGNVFHIDVDENEVVSHLRNVIRTKISQSITCDVMDLTLFLAKSSNGEWLRGDETLNAVLQSRDVSAYAKMRGTWKLSKPSLFGPNVSLGEEVVHVLVVVSEGNSDVAVENMERDAKRPRIEEDVALSKLWEFSEIKRTTIPSLDELSILLQRPLPFQVEVADFSTTNTIFDQSGPFFRCMHLTAMINFFLFACNRVPDSMASVNTWQYFYDQLLEISVSLYNARGFDIRSIRKCEKDPIGTTAKGLRPDYILIHDGLVLLRGEEKKCGIEIDVPCKKLTQKMRSWNPMFYGNLPYVLGYATSGERLRVVMIDRHLHTHTLLDFPSIFVHQAQVIKTFYNLAFVFQMMFNLSDRTCSSSLMPFTPHVTNKRTIELLDDVILRTIKLENCRDGADFNRLVHIYTTLENLNKRVKVRTYLQTVESFSKTALKEGVISVRLSPLGHERYPEDEGEVREWLRCMLTAFKYWHSVNYCHGNVCWPNILYVPASHSGYWVLIDMDESRQPNTATIDWNHEFNGHQLYFQHDMYQLGHLMETLRFMLPDDLVGIKKALLSAVDAPALTADVELTTILLDKLQLH